LKKKIYLPSFPPLQTTKSFQERKKLEREKKLFKKFSAFCQPAKNIYIFQTIFRLKKLSLNWKEAQTFRKQSRGAGNKKEQLFFQKEKVFFSPSAICFQSAASPQK
jgi:hypothetical protein